MNGPGSEESLERDVICIIGMHRSGTSMVARLLHLCGLDLGPAENLIGPDAGNPLGHFEHAGFHRIDEALLGHFGGSWDNPPELKPGWEQDSSLAHLTEEAKRLIDTFAESPLWGWKEPRAALLLPFWKSIIPRLRFVICVRSPLDVARSLEKRNRISIGAGAFLWNRYLRAVIRDTEGYGRLFTFYDDYFVDFLPAIERVVEFCGLSLGESVSHLRDAVSQELRHHTSETATLFDADSIPAQYKLFYLCLRALTSNRIAPFGSALCGRDANSDLAGGLLRLMTALDEQEKVAQLQSLLAKKDQELQVVCTNLVRQLDEKERRVSELATERNDLLAQNARLQVFSDAVRRTFAFRFYSRVIKPFKSS